MGSVGADSSEWYHVLTLEGNGYATIPSAADLQNPTQMTIEAWVRPDSTGSNQQTFIGNSDGASANTDRLYELVWFATGANSGPGSRIEVNFIVGTANWFVIGAPAPADQ